MQPTGNWRNWVLSYVVVFITYSHFQTEKLNFRYEGVELELKYFLCIYHPGFFLDACLEVIGGWFLRCLEFLEIFVEFFGHFVEFFGKFIEFLATLLEFLIFLYLFSPKPMILFTFPWEKDEFFLFQKGKSPLVGWVFF